MDIEITKQLKSAGETLGIKLLDHIIFNKKGCYSFLENNELYMIFFINILSLKVYWNSEYITLNLKK